MSQQREITLDTAAFLDSPQALALAAVPREDARKIVDRFLACCYEELGKAPRHLDGQDLHGIVGHLLPGHFGRRDPLAAHVPEVLRAYLGFLGERAVVSQMFELRHALEGTLDEFQHSIETGEQAHHAPTRAQKPFVHQADKVGRNDPCPCGSGKKFKACSARL
jgi:hypothetical protein